MRVYMHAQTRVSLFISTKHRSLHRAMHRPLRSNPSNGLQTAFFLKLGCDAAHQVKIQLQILRDLIRISFLLSLKVSNDLLFCRLIIHITAFYHFYGSQLVTNCLSDEVRSVEIDTRINQILDLRQIASRDLRSENSSLGYLRSYCTGHGLN